MKENKQRSDCPIAYSLDYLGDKWMLLILRDLIFTNKSSYGEFLTSEEKIATNVLANRLKVLEENGFIKSASISIVARNVAILLKHTPNIDPESNYNNTNAQGLELAGYPTVRNFGFNLNVKF